MKKLSLLSVFYWQTIVPRSLSSPAIHSRQMVRMVRVEHLQGNAIASDTLETVDNNMD